VANEGSPEEAALEVFAALESSGLLD
jgi:hypothetical protein